jgi:hypothetical protein
MEGVRNQNSKRETKMVTQNSYLNIVSTRFCISENEASSIWVIIVRLFPKGSVWHRNPAGFFCTESFFVKLNSFFSISDSDIRIQIYPFGIGCVFIYLLFLPLKHSFKE